MALQRVLEPEVMDTAEEAIDYDAMDHAAVNRLFVTDFLFAAQAAGLAVAEVPSAGSRVRQVRADAPEPAARGASAQSLDAPYGFVEVLDLGTGTAQIPVELCRRAPNIRITAVDLAAEMLQMAKINVELAALRDRIQLDRIDAKELPYDDGRFDALISNSIVHHIPEPAAVLAEAVRVVRPGGLIFIRDLLRPDDDATVHRLVATYAAGAIEHQRAMFDASLRAALNLDEIRALIAALGFAPKSVRGTSDRHWTWTARK
ncbi:MAG TPA: class I SAM-dependent methyltransferase [Pirellulales bacterium]|jgi:SAM-dependent methyltransferase|nr:class I SAM-dependent methyltransferase [Pirellulales bacterium]